MDRNIVIDKIIDDLRKMRGNPNLETTYQNKLNDLINYKRTSLEQWANEQAVNLYTTAYENTDWTNRSIENVGVRHMVRKYCHSKLGMNLMEVVRLEGSVTGTQPHHSTVINSFKTSVPYEAREKFNDILYE